MTPGLSRAGPAHHARAARLPPGAEAESPWSTWSDEDLLVEHTRQTTREAFEELVHRYQRPLHGYLHQYLGDAGLAEDVFQATFLEVHLHCRDFDPNRRFKPWAYSIATARAIDLLRRNRRHRLVSLDARGQNWADNQPADLADAKARTPLEQLESNEIRQQFRLLVDALPTRLRSVFVPVMFGGLEYHEAAEALGIPIGTVKSRIHTAMCRLRRILVVPA